MQQTSPAEQHWYVLALVEALSWLTADTVRDDDEILPVNGLQSSIGEASKKCRNRDYFKRRHKSRSGLLSASTMPRAGLVHGRPAANLPDYFRSSAVFTHFGPPNRSDRKTSSTANLNRNA
jgi:hypothetical protein